MPGEPSAEHLTDPTKKERQPSLASLSPPLVAGPSTQWGRAAGETKTATVPLPVLPQTMGVGMLLRLLTETWVFCLTSLSRSRPHFYVVGCSRESQGSSVEVLTKLAQWQLRIEATLVW